MDSIRIVIQTEPVAKQRVDTTWNNGHPHRYTPEKTKEAERILRERFMRHADKRFPEQVGIRLSTTFYRTKSIYLPKSMTLPCIRPDLDNMVKLELDSLNDILVPDDSEITCLYARKRWTDRDTGYIEVKLENDEV